MPLPRHFISGVPAPLHLLDLADRKLFIVPLACPQSAQTNPLYVSPPGQGDGEKYHRNWTTVLPAIMFGVGRTQNHVLLYASVMINSDEHRFINIWCGSRLDALGTLYCSIEHNIEHWHSLCLCGRCDPIWFSRGWACPRMFIQPTSCCGCSCGCRDFVEPTDNLQCDICRRHFGSACCWGPWGFEVCCRCIYSWMAANGDT